MMKVNPFMNPEDMLLTIAIIDKDTAFVPPIQLNATINSMLIGILGVFGI